MKTQEIDTLDYQQIYSGVDRSPGLHLTDIIRYIGDELGLLKYQKTWRLELAGDVGFIWEHLLELAYKDRLGARLGEVELDGIIGSPDGLGDDPFDVYPAALEEYKVTWTSSNTHPSEVWKWMVQCKGYCKMLDLRCVVMRILYLMGDYRGSGPQFRAYRIEFNDNDINKNWAMLLGSKDKVKHGG